MSKLLLLAAVVAVVGALLYPPWTAFTLDLWSVVSQSFADLVANFKSTFWL